MMAGRRFQYTRLLIAIPLIVSCAMTPAPKVERIAVVTPPASAPAPPAPSASPPTVLAVPPPALPEKVPLGPVDKKEVLRSWMEQHDRLYRVAAPLLLKNVQACGDRTRNMLGFTAKNKYSNTEDFIDAATELGFDDRLRVVTVLPGSGAERAGIEQGDKLLVVGIEPLPTARDAQSEAGALISAELQGRDMVRMTVSREDERITTDVPLTPACAFAIELGDADEPAAYSDRNRILVTRGMIRQASSDRVLANVIAREMARSLLMQGPGSTSAQVIDTLGVLHADAPVGLPPEQTAPDAVDASLRAALAQDLLQRAGYIAPDAATIPRRRP
jgi:beta-barrel assembly-enhancing protease